MWSRKEERLTEREMWVSRKEERLIERKMWSPGERNAYRKEDVVYKREEQLTETKM
jgi:hypothetical protein